MAFRDPELVRSERFRFRDAHVVPSVPAPGEPSGTASGLAARRKLVLDFNLAELQWFSQIVPADDRMLVDQHMTSLRELEQKLAQQGPQPEP